jgi:hypothetical protein
MASTTTTDEAPAKPEPRRSGGPGSRTRLVIAMLIAVASVLAGIATWRSDSDNRAGIDAINAADVQDRERQGAIDEIDANLNDSRITLVRVRVDERRAQALAATARAKGTPPATRRRAAALAAGYQAMATVIRERIEPDVLANGLTQAAFAKARALLIETAEARRDLDPKPELALNARLNQRAEDLRELGVAALIVALLLTCAEVLASGWYRLFLAVGVAGLVASAILMLTVGFGT